MNKAIPLNVLIADDSRDDATLLVDELNSAGFDVRWQQVDTEADFLAGLDKEPDIVLSDYTMPQFNGLRALDLLKEKNPDFPFILISGTMGEDTAVEAVKRGATDYLLKDRITRLGTAVRRALQQVAEQRQRRKLEAQFIEAQKMEVLGQLASGVAHDFNNILMAIMGYSDLASMQSSGDPVMQEYLDEIRHSSQRAAGLTRQLLVFSRKEKVLPVVLDLNEAVKDMEKMLRRLIGENIDMSIIPCSEPARIKADSGYVGQVLMNLAVNARDAMSNGGKLTISVSDAGVVEGAPGGTRQNYVMLSVADTGSGMTPEVKARLFEAFFTTKPKGKGTGLGLATCHTIVQQTGGHIEVDSEPGKGTAFRIYFPAAEQKAAAATRPVQGPVPRGTETLLVVEDESPVRNLACGLLAAQGYEVLAAANGHEALLAITAHKGSPVRLVVTDVIMPVMGGKVMAEWLQATYPDIRILFTSGYTDDALGPQGVLEKGVEFLSKPYSTATLARKVREILDR